MNEEEALVKRGPRKQGRQRTRAEVEAVVAQYEQSDLTLKEFADQGGLKLGGLRSWVYQVRRRRRQKETGPKIKAGFAAVKIKEHGGGKTTLYWPNGMAVELALDEASLVRVLQKLTPSCSR